jgi:hypothetical protein
LSSRRLAPPPFGTKQLDTAFLSSIKEYDLADLARGSKYVIIPPISTDPVVTMGATRAISSNRRPTSVPTGGPSGYGRCATHVAIAYYIYYQSHQKRDPTTTAKQLKDKSTFPSVPVPPLQQQQARGRTNGTVPLTTANAIMSATRVNPGQGVHVPPPSTVTPPYYKYPTVPPGTTPPRPQQPTQQQQQQPTQTQPQVPGKGVPPVNGTFPGGYVQPPMGMQARPPGVPPFPNANVTPPNRGVSAPNVMPGAAFQGLAPSLQPPGRGTFPTGYPYGQPYGTNQQFVQMRPNATPPQPQRRPQLPTGTAQPQTQPMQPQQPQQRAPIQQQQQQPITTNPLNSLGNTVGAMTPQQQQQPQQQHIRPTANISTAVSLAPKLNITPAQPLQQQIQPQYKPPQQPPQPPQQPLSDVKQEKQ